MNITSILTAGRAHVGKKAADKKKFTLPLEYCTDCTHFVSALNQYLSLEVFKISTCCRSGCAGLLFWFHVASRRRADTVYSARLGSARLFPVLWVAHCFPPQWRARIVRSSLVNWLITSLMRAERPRHNVRIVGNGQVTSEPKNKAVLNLMKCPPTPPSPDGAGEIPEHGVCVPGEAASWGSLMWKATTKCFWQIHC